MGKRGRRRRAAERTTPSRSGRHRSRPGDEDQKLPSRVTRKELSKYRFRSAREKVLGACLIVFGVAVVIVNYASEPNGSGEGLHVLPGGHSPLYVPLGIAIAVWGVWWTGLFDRQ